jgi:hypothetical protein
MPPFAGVGAMQRPNEPAYARATAFARQREAMLAALERLLLR